jgi:DNA-binding transcriptional regulator YiaG
LGIAAIERLLLSPPLKRDLFVTIPTLTPEPVKAIREAVAKSPREFSRRFGIPARTLNCA